MLIGGDYLSESGARFLARMISDFWKALGFEVGARVEHAGVNLTALAGGGTTIYAVRSSLDARGLPAEATHADIRRIRSAIARRGTKPQEVGAHG